MSSDTGFRPAIKAKAKVPRNTNACTEVDLHVKRTVRSARNFEHSVQTCASNPLHCHVSGMLKEYGIYFRQILPILNTDEDFCSLLSIAVTKEETSACVTHLVTTFIKVGAPASVYSDHGIFSTFLSYCNLASSAPHIGQNLRQAIKSRKQTCAFR